MDAFRAWCARNRLALAVVAAGWLVRLALILLGGQFCWPDEWRYYRGVELLSRLTHGERCHGQPGLRLGGPRQLLDLLTRPAQLRLHRIVLDA